MAYETLTFRRGRSAEERQRNMLIEPVEEGLYGVKVSNRLLALVRQAWAYEPAARPSAAALHRMLSIERQAPRKEWTPLHARAAAGDADGLLDVLAEISERAKGDAAAVVHGLDFGVNDVSVNGKTALALAAASMDCLPVIDALVAHGAAIDARCRKEGTPLAAAAEAGREANVGALLRLGANPNVQDADRRIPLHQAARSGSAACVTLLLDGGSALDPITRNGNTPLYLAADAGHVDAASVLLAAGADLTVRNAFGRTALHAATLNRHGSVVAVLLRSPAGQTVVDAKSRVGAGGGETALWLASRAGDVDLVEMLLQLGHANPNGVAGPGGGGGGGGNGDGRGSRTRSGGAAAGTTSAARSRPASQVLSSATSPLAVATQVNFFFFVFLVCIVDVC